MAVLVRALEAFGHFWWDFLVGDTPELFIAMLVLVGLAFALRNDRPADIVVLPLVTILVLVGSTWRGRVRGASRRARRG